MNFDAFWQSHRRFLTGAAGGVLVFLICRAVIDRTAGAEVAGFERAIRASSQSLADFHVSAREVQRAEQRLADLERRAFELAELALPPGPDSTAFAEYRPRAGQSPSQHYIEFTGLRRQELIRAALLRGAEIDESLGLPVESPTQPQQIERTLRGFYIVEQVVKSAVEYGAGAIEDIRIELPKPRRDQILDLTPVTLDVLLAEERVAPFLNDVLRPGRALGYVGHEVLPLDRKRRLRTVTLRFEAALLPAAPGAEEELP